MERKQGASSMIPDFWDDELLTDMSWSESNDYSNGGNLRREEYDKLVNEPNIVRYCMIFSLGLLGKIQKISARCITITYRKDRTQIKFSGEEGDEIFEKAGFDGKNILLSLAHMSEIPFSLPIGSKGSLMTKGRGIERLYHVSIRGNAENMIFTITHTEERINAEEQKQSERIRDRANRKPSEEELKNLEKLFKDHPIEEVVEVDYKGREKVTKIKDWKELI